MIGRIIIDILFIAALIATTSFFISEKNKNPLYKKVARFCFYLVSGGLIITAGYFLYLIFNHDFRYAYIFNYSSKDTPLFLLVSTFYAGQEGSFFLWSLMFAIIGMFLMPYARRKDYESGAMGIFSLILSFLLLLLIVKSPFKYIWEADPSVAQGFMPMQGRGLNPILENFWIIIHPPILFLGYAATSIPFIFSVTALIKKDYTGWINVAMPWTLFASGILGLGIGLGGYWAYETLGWGGFWGWDPVENTSLMPWLISMALVHTMLVQRKTGGLFKTNYFLAITSFVLVLYATFLTRSGILGDVSVHSFVDPGGTVYALLLLFILIFLVGGLVLLFMRMKDMEANKLNFSLSSKESVVTLGAIMLMVSTFIVFIGTSFPLFLELTGQAKTTVEITFYDKWNIPIAVLILILCGLAFFVNWKDTKFSSRIKGTLLPLAFALIVVAILYLAGVNQFKHLLIAFGSVYCMYASIYFSLSKVLKSPRQIGSYLAHAGVGLFFLGVIFSGGYTVSSSLALGLGETKSALGYNMTFIGIEQIEKDKKDREKYKCKVQMEKDDNVTIVSPIVYWSNFNDRQAPFFVPGIATHLSKDIYISPKSLANEGGKPTFILQKNQTAALPEDTTIKMTLIGFDMSHGMGAQQGEPFTFGGIVKFDIAGKELVDTLLIHLDMASGISTPEWQELEGTDYNIGFSDFQVDQTSMANSHAAFTILKKGQQPVGQILTFTFEASTKPFISFVWFGVMAMVLGFFIAVYKNKNAMK